MGCIGPRKPSLPAQFQAVLGKLRETVAEAGREA